MHQRQRISTAQACKCSDCHVHPGSEWCTLKAAELEQLDRAIVRKTYRGGETLFAMGDENSGVYCVSEGLIGLRRLDEEGHSVLLSIARPGDTVGYQSYLIGDAHRFSAESLGPSSVCFIYRDTLSWLLARNPQLGLQFLKRAIKDLYDARDAMMQSLTLSNRERLVHLLLVWLRHHGEARPDGSHALRLPLSRSDIASMIGTRQETLSRIIGRLKSDGIAQFSGRSVRVPSIRTLANELETRPAA